jgi:hypothetical protein
MPSALTLYQRAGCTVRQTVELELCMHYGQNRYQLSNVADFKNIPLIIPRRLTGTFRLAAISRQQSAATLRLAVTVPNLEFAWIHLRTYVHIYKNPLCELVLASRSFQKFYFTLTARLHTQCQPHPKSVMIVGLASAGQHPSFTKVGGGARLATWVLNSIIKCAY